MGSDLGLMTSKPVFFPTPCSADTQPRKTGPGGQAAPPPGESQRWPQRSWTPAAVQLGDTESQALTMVRAKLSAADGPKKGATGVWLQGELRMAVEERQRSTLESLWQAGR